MSENGETGPSRSGRKSCCLIGCLGGGFVVVALLVSGGAWIGSFTTGFGEAEELRAQREVIADEAPFAPAADGRVPADRLEAYLRIRGALEPNCTELDGFFGAIERLEDKTEPGNEPGFKDGLAVAVAGMKLPGLLSEYYQVRNRGLVEERMTLDEWRWYTVLAYRSADGTYRPEGAPADRSGRRSLSGDNELVRRTLVSQLEAARAAGPEAVGADWIAALEAEAARLDEPEATGWPWTEGLPASVAESLAPFADELVAAHCRHAEQFEFGEVQQEGMSIRVD